MDSTRASMRSQRLAAEMLPFFESRDVRLEALAALVLLRGAVDTERVS